MDWDNAYLVQQFKSEAGIAAASEYDDLLDILPRLSRAQPKVIEAIASRFTNPLYQAPTQLTSADGGFTYTFGLDGAGNPQVAMGWVQLAPSKNAFSGDTFVGWVEGRDFLNEGARIRIVSNRAYLGQLWGRWVPVPPPLAGVAPTTVASVLDPAFRRNLIVIRAVWDWAAEGATNLNLQQTMKGKWNDEFPSAMLAWRRGYRGGGALLDPARWYFAAPDLGSGNSRY